MNMKPCFAYGLLAFLNTCLETGASCIPTGVLPPDTGSITEIWYADSIHVVASQRVHSQDSLFCDAVYPVSDTVSLNKVRTYFSTQFPDPPATYVTWLNRFDENLYLLGPAQGGTPAEPRSEVAFGSSYSPAHPESLMYYTKPRWEWAVAVHLADTLRVAVAILDTCVGRTQPLSSNLYGYSDTLVTLHLVAYYCECASVMGQATENLPAEDSLHARELNQDSTCSYKRVCMDYYLSRKYSTTTRTRAATCPRRLPDTPSEGPYFDVLGRKAARSTSGWALTGPRLMVSRTRGIQSVGF